MIFIGQTHNYPTLGWPLAVDPLRILTLIVLKIFCINSCSSYEYLITYYVFLILCWFHEYLFEPFLSLLYIWYLTQTNVCAIWHILTFNLTEIAETKTHFSKKNLIATLYTIKLLLWVFLENIIILFQEVL